MSKKIILMAALAVSVNIRATTMKGGFYCDGLRNLAVLVTALSEHNNAEAMTIINRGT